MTPRSTATRQRPRVSDVDRLDAIIRRLLDARSAMPGVRAHLAEQAEGEVMRAAGPSSLNTRSINDPTGAAMPRVSPILAQGRALDRAMQGIESSVEHLRIEAERALGRTSMDTRKESRCPEMVLSNDGYDDVLAACNIISHYTRRPDGTIEYRADQRCTEHGRLRDRADYERQRYRKAAG